MPDNAPRLLKLAEAEFPDLTEPEREVLRCAAVGEVADLTQWGPQPAEGEERKPGGGPLRSAVVTWLCTDESAKRLVVLHRKGVRIAFATLDTQLDLMCAYVPFYFGLRACRLPGLDAAGSRFHNILSLIKCQIDGILNISNSYIGVQLQCNGALVHGDDGISIKADGVDIGGSAFFSEGFRAEGEVRLLGAKIQGQLNCTGGQILNRKGKALSADRADIGSNVFLSEGFHAEGEVRLIGAKIKGQLDCTGGRFLNCNGIALCADGAEIDNDVFLSHGFHAEGEVRLIGTKIKEQGQLDCTGGTFLNMGGAALHLQQALISSNMFLEPKHLRGEVCLHSAEVNGTLRMRSESTANASLDLRNAKVGVLLDSRDSWPEAGSLGLDGFEYGDIDHNSPRSAAERLEWLGRMSSYQFLPQPYKQLAAWFQRIGHDKEAVTIRIAMEDKRSKLFTQKWAKFWRWLISWTVGYGYKPHFALGWLGLLVMTGWLVFALGHRGMTQSVSYQYAAVNDNATYGTANATNYPEFNALIYSLDVALPIIDLQQERYWMPNSEVTLSGCEWWRCGELLWWANWIEVLLGWIFTSIGIAGATDIIRKD